MLDSNQAEYLVNKLDYDKIRSIMVLTNHKWGDEIPNVTDLKDAARQCIMKVATLKTWRYAIGGFTAIKTGDENDPTYMLFFAPPTYMKAECNSFDVV